MPRAKRVVEATKDFFDMNRWGIRKGTRLHVMKEGPKHPTRGHRVLLVRVDNGTGITRLMPETCIHDTDPIKEVKS